MFDDEIGLGGAQLLERVVTGEDGAGMDAAMPGGFDVVLHIADEQGLVGDQLVFLEDFVDFFAFIPDAEVRFVEVLMKSDGGGLDGEMVAMDGAQKEGPDA